MNTLGSAAERTLKKRLKRLDNKARRYAHEVASECAEAAWRKAGADETPAGKAVFDEHYGRVFDELFKAKLAKLLEDGGYSDS